MPEGIIIIQAPEVYLAETSGGTASATSDAQERKIEMAALRALIDLIDDLSRVWLVVQASADHVDED
jgi:hypothetical protein